MAVTIADIAREAGVSIATVSRVINNTKPVSSDLKNRVFDIIEKNNFKPNELARGLITKKTNIIGVIVPDISNSVFGALIKGINIVCSKKGYTLMVTESGGDINNEIKLLDVLADKKIDGILFAGINVNHKLITEMQTKDYPVILVTQEASDGEGIMDTVVHDNIKAVYDATKFLIDNGHKRIAYIGGPKIDYSSGKKRLKGYKLALEDAKIKLIDSLIEQGEFSFQAGYLGMKKMYEENSVLPTAVVTGSDIIAMGVIQFLTGAGVNVPDDISVIGFDDLEFSTYFKPELSTVRISYFDEGAIAANELIKIIDGENITPQTHYVPHKIIRRSTIKNIN
ncbi:MAG: LacI family DNA-binding transcriptional regulator [Herbinix sp.]|nr:LacI family DNA-binding transcriptional regulator [Herbinix sp.]